VRFVSDKAVLGQLYFEYLGFPVHIIIVPMFQILIYLALTGQAKG